MPSGGWVVIHHVFFSWQSDIPNGIGRGFVQSCLERAIGALQADAEIDLADRQVAINRGALDVPDSRPSLETDRVAVFLPDLTFVIERRNVPSKNT